MSDAGFDLRPCISLPMGRMPERVSERALRRGSASGGNTGRVRIVLIGTMRILIASKAGPRRAAAPRLLGRRRAAAGLRPEWPEGVAGIGDAVRRVLSDPSYRFAAGRGAAEVAALPPIDDAMAVLGDWLEMARAA